MQQRVDKRMVALKIPKGKYSMYRTALEAASSKGAEWKTIDEMAKVCCICALCAPDGECTVHTEAAGTDTDTTLHTNT